MLLRLQKSRFPLFLLCGLLAMPVTGDVYAQGAGDLMLAPSRVVFEERTRTAMISLINRGTETATYRISVVNLRMSERGEIAFIDEAGEGEQFAGGMFRYAPRQVTIEPRRSQSIRILLRKPADLADGEYRSHLQFMAVPPDDVGQILDQEPNTGGIQVRLIPQYGVTIPVIVRHGEVDLQVSISDAVLMSPPSAEGPAILRLTLNREGSRSAYGNITVHHVPGVGARRVVGQVNGLAVYVPNASRTVDVPLRVADGAPVAGGELTISYNATRDEGGDLLAESRLILR